MPLWASWYEIARDFRGGEPGCVLFLLDGLHHVGRFKRLGGAGLWRLRTGGDGRAEFDDPGDGDGALRMRTGLILMLVHTKTV